MTYYATNKIPKELNEKFMNACESGDVIVLKELLTMKERNWTEREFQEKVIEIACKHTSLDILKALLESSTMRSCFSLNFLMKEIGNKILKYGCIHNNMQVVKYILETNQKHNLVADIHTDSDDALIIAVRNNNMEMVKYLLMSPNLSEHIDVNTRQGQALSVACLHGHLEMVQYLMTSSELKTNISFKSKGDLGGKYAAFKNACQGGSLKVIQYLMDCKEDLRTFNIDFKGFKLAYVKGHNHIINYFIFDYKIEKSDELKKWAKDKEEINKLFALRHMTNRLETKLEQKEEKIVRRKI